jgi:MFS family permease
MDEGMAVKSAGMVVMLYTATAMAGTYVLCRLASRVAIHRVLIFAGILGTAMQFLLSASPGVFSFVGVRMLQTAMIAAVIPLVFSTFSSDQDGRIIGFLNSSRFAGNALGPMIATSILAFSGFLWVYFSVASLALLALAGYAFSFARARQSRN